MRNSRTGWKILWVACVFMLPACTIPGRTTPQAPDELQGGILATFAVNGEQFRVWVTNETTIQQIRDLQAGESMANIPNGVIRRGPGPGNYNAPYNWHLDPQEIEMAEMTIELCDGAPSYVEENIAEFVDTVGRYCPWSAELENLQDLSGQQQPIKEVLG